MSEKSLEGDKFRSLEENRFANAHKVFITSSQLLNF